MESIFILGLIALLVWLLMYTLKTVKPSELGIKPAKQGKPKIVHGKFGEYLKSKQKLLVIWFFIHGLALFVNHFKIEGNIIDKLDDEKSTEINLFMDKDEADNEKPETRFWPFINFYKYSYNQDIGGGNPEEWFWFYGLFTMYDSSEFIAYSILIFIILYFMWSSQNKPIQKSVN